MRCQHRHAYFLFKCMQAICEALSACNWMQFFYRKNASSTIRKDAHTLHSLVLCNMISKWETPIIFMLHSCECRDSEQLQSGKLQGIGQNRAMCRLRATQARGQSMSGPRYMLTLPGLVVVLPSSRGSRHFSAWITWITLRCCAITVCALLYIVAIIKINVMQVCLIFLQYFLQRQSDTT